MCVALLVVELAPIFPPATRAVHLHITVDRHDHKLVGLDILELHDLMSGTSEFAPPTRLLRVLLDRLIFAPVHGEPHRSQVMNTGAAHAQGLASHFDLRAVHHLLDDRLEQRNVRCAFHRATRLLFRGPLPVDLRHDPLGDGDRIRDASIDRR
jgi:hypothetical protein